MFLKPPNAHFITLSNPNRLHFTRAPSVLMKRQAFVTRDDYADYCIAMETDTTSYSWEFCVMNG